MAVAADPRVILRRVPHRHARAKLAKVDAAGRPWPGTVAQSAYVAKLVWAAELRHVLCAYRGTEHLGARAVAWIAGRQLGLIACWQLQAVGVSSSAMTRRLRRGVLHRVYRGVFLVGHALLVPGA